jgi:hypothetical protein
MNRSELQSGFVGLVWLSSGGLLGMRWGCFAALGIGLVAGAAGFVVGLFLLTLSDDLDLRLIRWSERRPRLGSVLRCLEGLVSLAFLVALLVMPFVLAVHFREPNTD